MSESKLSKSTFTDIERRLFLHSQCRFRHCDVDRQEECPYYFGIIYPGE